MFRKLLLFLIVFAGLTTLLKAQYAFVGNAFDAGNGCYTLTNASLNQMGAIWYQGQINLTQDFDIKAELNLGSGNGGGADGMAFVIQQQSSNAGALGQGLGYGNITPSIAVEFDTYRNQNLNDPNNFHMAIMANGNPNHANGLTPPISILSNGGFADNGQPIAVRFLYTAATNNLKVFVNCELRIDYTNNILQTIFNGNPNAFWGFTAATGGFVNQQTVCKISNSQFLNLNRTLNPCQQDFVFLDALNIPGAIYSWQPTTGLSNPAIRNPSVQASSNAQYICTITDPCTNQVFRDTVTIVPQAAPATPQLSLARTWCNGDSLLIRINNITPGIQYRWTLPNNTGFISNGISIGNAISNVAGTYTVVGATPNNCTSIAGSITVAPVNRPQITVQSNTPVCEGSSLQVQVQSDSAYNITWRGPNGLTANGSLLQLTAQANSGGTYVATARNQSGCTRVDSAVVVVLPPAVANIRNTDTLVCLGDSFTVRGSFGGGNLIWQPASIVSGSIATSFTVRPTTSTWLTAIASSGSGCIQRDSFLITVHEKPSVFAGRDTTIFKGFSVPLTLARVSGTAINFIWTPSTGLNDATLLNPLATPQLTTQYILSVNSAFCGAVSDTLTIRVLENIRVPNAFSPNGDGVNDTWVIEGLNTYRSATVEVFNRYGQPVFSAGRGYPQAWNGTFKGKPLAAGTFYYVITIPELNNTLSGWVMILK